MCKESPYITEEFCNKYNVPYRNDIVIHVKIPIALGMVLAWSPKDFGSEGWRKRFEEYMLNLYKFDCEMYDKYNNGSNWELTRKQFYDNENYRKTES